MCRETCSGRRWASCVPRWMAANRRQLRGRFRDGRRIGRSDPQAAAATEVPQPPLQRPQGFPGEPPLAGLLQNNPRSEHFRKQLPNGLQVIVVPNHEVPFVSLRLQLLAGSYTEQKIGAASMAMQMLDKGTEKHTEAELAEELDRYAISLGRRCR